MAQLWWVQLGETEGCHKRVLLRKHSVWAWWEGSQCCLQGETWEWTVDCHQTLQQVRLAWFSPIPCLLTCTLHFHFIFLYHSCTYKQHLFFFFLSFFFQVMLFVYTFICVNRLIVIHTYISGKFTYITAELCDYNGKWWYCYPIPKLYTWIPQLFVHESPWVDWHKDVSKYIYFDLAWQNMLCDCRRKPDKWEALEVNVWPIW